MVAYGTQRNRNVNKRTHCIVVDQDSLKAYQSADKTSTSKTNNFSDCSNIFPSRFLTGLQKIFSTRKNIVFFTCV
jgi:hypothetical protein